jgi:glycosyltransferase involved in cell wall biosynthesis
MRTALWLSLSLVFYTYVGYPVIIWILGRWFGKQTIASDITPSVSIVMAVRNGMALLSWRIDHLFSLDYPNTKEIIIVSDGSTDGTSEMLASLIDPRLKTVILPEHRGKAAALNAGMAEATADVILFVDIRPEIARGAIQKLVNRFADPRVGCVAGELLLSGGGHGAVTNSVGKLYWRYEQWIRKCEASYDSAVGVYGGFYAIRRALTVNHPEGMILDDMFEPLSIIRQGYRSVIERSTCVIDRWPHRTRSEFDRKVRTLAGNFQLMKCAPWILTPRNRVVFQFVSHKVLRLFVPYLLIVAMATSAFLASTSPAYATLATVQVAGWLLSIVGLRFRIPLLSRITGPAGALLLLNAAAVVGLYTFLAARGSLWRIWDTKGSQMHGSVPEVENTAEPKHA